MVGLHVFYLSVLLFCGGGVLSTPLCLTGDFDAQLQHILHTQVDYAQDPELIISRVLGDVRATLSQRWQGFKLIPFGSLTYGLVTKTSDLDVSIRLPNFNSTSSSYVLMETKQILQKHPELYTYLRIQNNLKCTDLCIQAVFALDANNGEVVVHEYAMKIKQFLKSVAEMFKELPRDSILRALVVKDEQKEIATKEQCNQSTE
ncbi:hypothetical protein PYW07_004745 [Mythimna separata]|uniref:Polymerase nucleotidyl transferase domain-containing protein n=1 Tax=Mythimna separata TaxID=271217 RepID=A0AAD7YY91_MYTSE|nr:hypothetical protein PYW07_004745 [Mythimna separata]